MSEAIRTSLDGAVLSVQICRPEKKNALTLEMYSAMTEALRRADDPDVRVVLFEGVEGAFTAGNDLEDFLAQPPQDPDAPVLQFLRALATTNAPLVAAVDGLAVGIGTTMLLHCDFVLATPRSRFSMPFINLGLCPEAGASMLLPRLAGYQEAARLLMLGEAFDTETATRIGMVGQVSEPDALIADATKTARALAAKPRGALRATKALLRQTEEPLGERIDREVARFTELLKTPASKECMSAFLEKRHPDPAKMD